MAPHSAGGAAGAGGGGTARHVPILNDISVHIESGKLVAIMGASGCGKTTLLSMLATAHNGHGLDARRAHTTGRILFNGAKLDQRTWRSVVGFVRAHDPLLPLLTVQETLDYAARLRLPSTVTRAEQARYVKQVINELGLRDCADTAVGDEWVVGCSGGERRRVMIGVQMLTDPSVLLLDEPTSGLDATTAQNVTATLKRIASRGRTVICSIHQPRSEQLLLFDKLILMAKGQIVYSGPVGEPLIEYFKTLGYERPNVRGNIGDWLLDLTATDLRNVASEAKSLKRLKHLIDNYAPVADPDPAAAAAAHDHSAKPPLDRPGSGSGSGSSASDRTGLLSAPGNSTPTSVAAQPRPHLLVPPNGSPHSVSFAEPYSPLIATSYSPPPLALPPPPSTTSAGMALVPAVDHKQQPHSPQQPLQLMPAGKRGSRKGGGGGAANQALIPHVPSTGVTVKLYHEPASFGRAFPVLLSRSMTTFRRGVGLIIARLLNCFGMGLILLIFCSDAMTHDQSGVQNRVGLIQFYCNLFFLGTCNCIAAFPAERDVYYRDRADGIYSTAPFFLSYLVPEMMYEASTALGFTAVACFGCGLRFTVPDLFLYALVFFLVINAGESLGITFCALVYNPGLSLSLMNPLVAVLAMMAGLYAPSMPTPLKYVNFTSILRYATRIVTIREFTGQTFYCSEEELAAAGGVCPFTTGEQVLEVYDFTESSTTGVYVDLAILVGLAVAYRVLAFLALRHGAKKQR